MADGKMKEIRFQIADVTKILVAVSKIAEADNSVNMHRDGGMLMDKKGNKYEMRKRTAGTS